MKKSIFVLLTVTLALCALFVSCNSEVTASQGDSKDLVSVSFDSGNSKGLSATIEPFDKGSYYWKYAARKNSADGTGLNSGATATYDEAGAVFIHEATKGLDGQVPGFSQGIWDFMLFAYKKVGSDYVLVFSGETPAVKLVKGGENKVLVTVSPSGTANGTLIIGETELTPASSADIPSVSRYVKVVKVGETTERTPVSGTEYSLEPGAYQVTVEYKANDIVYASDLVVATVYTGVRTLVTGNIDELTTYAVFDADANIIEDTVTSTSSSYNEEKEESTTTVNFSSSSETTKVTASTTEGVLQKYMKAVEATASNQETSLALKVETETATETTVSYEISMDAIIKTTIGTEVNTDTQDVKDLGANNYVTIILELQPGLEEVSVKHSNVSMAAGNGPEDDDSSRHGVYKYDAATGKLTIWTTTFSPFAVSFTVPVETYGVAQIGTTKYLTLEEAFNAANSEDTIKLLSNTEGAGLFLGAGSKTITIDLCGYTYTVTKNPVGSSTTQTQGLHLEQGNTVIIKNGKITSAAGSGVKMLVQNYSNLTLEDVVVDGSNIGNRQYALSNNCGNINITGNTSIIAPTDGRAFDVCGYAAYSGGVTVNVNTTGTITGKIEIDEGDKNYPLSLNISNGTFVGSFVGTSKTTDAEMKGIISISGGTFNFDPWKYVADKYEAVKNSVETWTVSYLGEYEAKIDSVYYATLEEAIGVAGSSDEIVELLRSIDRTGVIEIGKDVTIEGHCHSVNGTADRVFRITKPQCAVSMKDLNIISKCTATFDVRGISFDSASAGSSLTLDGCTVSASFYAINAIPGADNLTVTIKNGTVAAGWAAINSYSNNSEWTIENSVLSGLNDKAETSWNNFNTITFDGNGLNNDYLGEYGSNNTVHIKNSTVVSSSESANNQYWIGIQYGAQGNTIILSDDSVIQDGTEDGLSNLKWGYYYYKHNGEWKYYTPTSTLQVGDKVYQIGPENGFEFESVDAVYTYMNEHPEIDFLSCIKVSGKYYFLSSPKVNSGV